MATATIRFIKSTALSSGMGTVDSATVSYYGTITFSAAADTYLTGGLLPFTGFDLKSLGPYGDRTPLLVAAFTQSGSGYEYMWNVATGKLMITGGGGSGTAAPVEITNGTALNATTPTISTDVVAFVAVFPRK